MYSNILLVFIVHHVSAMKKSIPLCVFTQKAPHTNDKARVNPQTMHPTHSSIIKAHPQQVQVRECCANELIADSLLLLLLFLFLRPSISRSYLLPQCKYILPHQQCTAQCRERMPRVVVAGTAKYRQCRNAVPQQ